MSEDRGLMASVLVGVEFVRARHGDDQGAQGVQDGDGVLLGGQDVGEAAVDVRLSSRPPPRRMTPLRFTHSRIISCDTRPGEITLLEPHLRLPAACVRDMTRPAPWTVENNASF